MLKANLLFIIIMFLQGCTKVADPDKIYDIREKIVIKDISYGKAQRQKLNAFLPADRNENTRAIILIHGGGWQSGDKNDFDLFASMFAESGIASFIINYRYASVQNHVGYIEILEDIDNAISCIRDSSVKFTISPENICLLGHSAGGHLSMLYAYRNNQKKIIDKVVSLAGPTDLTDTDFLSITGVEELVNTLAGSDPGNRIDASPLTYANDVITILYHGKSDEVVPYQQSERLFEKIRGLNSRNNCRLIENCGHGFNAAELWNIATETVSLVND